MSRKQREPDLPFVCLSCKELVCRRNRCLKWLYATEDSEGKDPPKVAIRPEKKQTKEEKKDMEDKKGATILAKVRKAGGEYSLREILDYTQRAGFSPEKLVEMSGEEIIRIVEQQLNRAYRTRPW